MPQACRSGVWTPASRSGAMRAYCSLTLCLMLVVTVGVIPVGGAVGPQCRPEEGPMNGSLADVIREKHLFPEDSASYSQQQWQHLFSPVSVQPEMKQPDLPITVNTTPAIDGNICLVETNTSSASDFQNHSIIQKYFREEESTTKADTTHGTENNSYAAEIFSGRKAKSFNGDDWNSSAAGPTLEDNEEKKSNLNNIMLNASNAAQATNREVCPLEDFDLQTNSSRLCNVSLAAERSQSFGQDDLANEDVSELSALEAADAPPSTVTNTHLYQPAISQPANSSTTFPLKSYSLVVITPVTESIIMGINTSLDCSPGSLKPECPIVDFSLQAPSTAVTAAAFTYVEVFEAPVLGLYLVVYGQPRAYEESRLNLSGTTIDTPLAQQTPFLTLVQLSKGQRLFATVGPARSYIGQVPLGFILIQKY